MAERPSTVLDYGAFQQPPSALFRDYLTGAAKAAPFYDGARWDLEGLLAACERAAAASSAREDVARALATQQAARGAQRAAERAETLSDPRAVAVVTGQQSVLFGGPLFVLYKALGAIKLARLLEERRGAPVVAVFWVAADDHDFAEIRTTSVLDESGRIRSLRYAPRAEPAGQPAARIVLEEAVRELLDETAACLPDSPHKGATLALLTRCYRPGIAISQGFGELLASLFPELVVLDPSDAALKRAMLPVMCREIAEGSPTSRLAAEVAPRLRAAGYHQQVPVRDGFLNLFWYCDEERRSLAYRDGVVEVRGTPRRVTQSEAIAQLEREPELWSPGVLLRPLAQDRLLPTAAYVGGPAEIAYHAQIGPSYRHFGIARPTLVPRPSLTLVEAAQARALEAEGLGLADLQGDPEALLAARAREAHPEVEAAFARARDAVNHELTLVEETLGALDPTLKAAADSARGRTLHQIDTLHEKATRALKKRDLSRGDRLRRTRDALFPGGSLQERGLGLIGPLARHGSGLIEELRERMDVFAKGHQVIFL
jgi:bacillithiol biosynthesis cysteine-adding enzyme BshC